VRRFPDAIGQLGGFWEPRRCPGGLSERVWGGNNVPGSIGTSWCRVHGWKRIKWHVIYRVAILEEYESLDGFFHRIENILIGMRSG